MPTQYAELLLQIRGSRYEYEMNVLLHMAGQRIRFFAVPIQTIYLDDNRSSHFHPVRDSVRIYANILKFSASSLISAVVDITLFAILMNWVFASGTAGIFAATAIARVASSLCNFSLNRLWVFNSKDSVLRHAVLYYALCVAQMLASAGLVSLLAFIPTANTLIKVFVDIVLFFISYHVQRRFIFTNSSAKSEGRRLQG